MRKILWMLLATTMVLWAGPPLKYPLIGKHQTLDGGVVELFKDGRPVLVDFWASWCIACQYAVPHLMQFQKEHPQVRLIGVNVDDAQSLGLAKRFVKQTGMNYQSILDLQGKLTNNLQIEALPTLVLFSSQGKELWRSLGEPENLEAELRPFLK